MALQIMAENDDFGLTIENAKPSAMPYPMCWMSKTRLPVLMRWKYRHPVWRALDAARRF